MLTEEQIQRLVKKLADESVLDEEVCKEYVCFMDKTISDALVPLPEDKRECLEKILQGGFFEGFIKAYFLVGDVIVKIARMFPREKPCSNID